VHPQRLRPAQRRNPHRRAPHPQFLRFDLQHETGLHQRRFAQQLRIGMARLQSTVSNRKRRQQSGERKQHSNGKCEHGGDPWLFSVHCLF